MKYLLAFLLIGSFLSPVRSQEVGITLENFIEKVGHAKPWTRENIEKKLGIKFVEQTLSTEMYRGYTAYDPPLSATANMPIDYISLDTLRVNNKTHSVRAYIDSDSVCLDRFDMRALYPKGVFDSSNVYTGGGLAYYDGRSWGVVRFSFSMSREKGECLHFISFKEDQQVKEYDEDILKQIRGQK